MTRQSWQEWNFLVLKSYTIYCSIIFISRSESIIYNFFSTKCNVNTCLLRPRSDYYHTHQNKTYRVTPDSKQQLKAASAKIGDRVSCFLGNQIPRTFPETENHFIYIPKYTAYIYVYIIVYLKYHKRSRGCSASMVSGYGMDDRVIQVLSPAKAKDFSSNLLVQTGSQPPVQWVPGVLSSGVKRSRSREWVGAISLLPLRLHRCALGLLSLLVSHNKAQGVWVTAYPARRSVSCLKQLKRLSLNLRLVRPNSSLLRLCSLVLKATIRRHMKRLIFSKF
jgi:hypothetical protein